MLNSEIFIEIIIDLHAVVRTKSLVRFTQFPPVVTFYKTTVQIAQPGY